MKLVIVKSDTPLKYKGDGYELILFGGCEINKVDDVLWDKVMRDFEGNVNLLQENEILEVSESKGNKKSGKKVDEESLQDLVHNKISEQNDRTPNPITNDNLQGAEL